MGRINIWTDCKKIEYTPPEIDCELKYVLKILWSTGEEVLRTEDLPNDIKGFIYVQNVCKKSKENLPLTLQYFNTENNSWEDVLTETNLPDTITISNSNWEQVFQHNITYTFDSFRFRLIIKDGDKIISSNEIVWFKKFVPEIVTNDNIITENFIDKRVCTDNNDLIDLTSKSTNNYVLITNKHKLSEEQIRELENKEFSVKVYWNNERNSLKRTKLIEELHALTSSVIDNKVFSFSWNYKQYEVGVNNFIFVYFIDNVEQDFYTYTTLNYNKINIGLPILKIYDNQNNDITGSEIITKDIFIQILSAVEDNSEIDNLNYYTYELWRKEGNKNFDKIASVDKFKNTIDSHLFQVTNTYEGLSVYKVKLILNGKCSTEAQVTIGKEKKAIVKPKFVLTLNQIRPEQKSEIYTVCYVCEYWFDYSLLLKNTNNNEMSEEDKNKTLEIGYKTNTYLNDNLVSNNPIFDEEKLRRILFDNTEETYDFTINIGNNLFEQYGKEQNVIKVDLVEKDTITVVSSVSTDKFKIIKKPIEISLNINAVKL